MIAKIINRCSPFPAAGCRLITSHVDSAAAAAQLRLNHGWSACTVTAQVGGAARPRQGPVCSGRRRGAAGGDRGDRAPACDSLRSPLSTLHTGNWLPTGCRPSVPDECLPATQALCTPGAVLWTGFLSGVELWQAFASADVFFSGSATEALPLVPPAAAAPPRQCTIGRRLCAELSGPLSQVYLEAMASGLAVCGPDAGGVPDTFTDGVQGGLFTSMDTESAVAALGRTVEIAAAKGRVDRIRKDAEQFTWTRSIAQLTGPPRRNPPDNPLSCIDPTHR